MIPFVIISSTLPYAGARPPEAPLIKARGQLRIRDERVGWKTIRRFEFITEAKTVYRVSERQTSVKLYRLFQRNLPNLYVEGFVLRDGHGYFFPTQAVSEAEGVLVDEKGQYESLNVGADVVWKLVFDWMWISFPLIVIFVWKFFKIRSFIKIGR